jgi:hypothetical protein
MATVTEATYLRQTRLPSTAVHSPAGNSLNRLNERVAQPLRELVERDKVIALSPDGTRRIKRSPESRAWPYVTEDLVRRRGERRARRPDGREERKERVPEGRKGESGLAVDDGEVRSKVA